MSSSAQLKTITSQLSDYFTKLSLNLTNTANPMPSFEDYVALLDYSTIYDESLDGVDRAASYSTGALTDTVHQTIAINREFSMRAKTKPFYFSDGVADANNDASRYVDMYGKYFNYFRGTAPEQGSQ